MNFPTLLLCIALAICGFMLLWDGDASLRQCQAAGIQSDDVCFAALNP